MYTVFSDTNKHKITEANINFYANPFIHPKRNISEHDFIYILQGEWKFGQNNEEYVAKKDDILLLCANNTHYGISPCQPNTKTMYFHATCENDFSYTSPQTGNCIKSHIDSSINPNIKKYFSEIINAKLQGKQKRLICFFKFFCMSFAIQMNTPKTVILHCILKTSYIITPKNFSATQSLQNCARFR